MKDRTINSRSRLLELYQAGVPRSKANVIMKKEFRNVARNTVRAWYKKFERGNITIQNKPRKKVPRIFEPEDVIRVLSEEPNLSSLDLAKRLKTTKKTILERLHEMKYIYVDNKWVPSIVDEEEEQQKVAKSEIIENIKEEPKKEDIFVQIELEISQKVFLVRCCYENRRDYESVRQEFEYLYNLRTTESFLQTIENVVELFEMTGSVLDSVHFEVVESISIETEVSSPILNSLVIKNEIDSFPIPAIEKHPRRKYIRKPKDAVEDKKDTLQPRPAKSLEMREIPKQSLNYECEVCKKVFKSLTSIRMHMQIHEGKTYPCDICNKTYATKLYLQRHKLNHRPIEERKKFICDICGKGSTQKANHEKHLVIHFGKNK